MSLNFKSILLVTYGRSGSTLLQGLLNKIDGMLVRGENRNFIYDFYTAYQKLVMAREKCGYLGKDATGSWYGIKEIDFKRLEKNISQTIKDILLGDYLSQASKIQCYGFKEIKYIDVEDLDSYLQFLQKVMPDVGFIFNTRNLDDVVKSAWWQNTDSKETKAVLRNLETKFVSYAKQHPKNTFAITYEDVVAKSSKVKEMFEFLGAEYSKEIIDSVLSIEHSAGNKSMKINEDKRIIYAQPSIYSDYFKEVKIDRLPKKIVANKNFTFEGIVVVNNDSISIKEIKAVSPNSDTSVSALYGLSSSFYGIKYPNISSSSYARFKFTEIKIAKQQQIKVVVILECDREIEIGSVDLKPVSES